MKNKINKPKDWFKQIVIRPTISPPGYPKYEKLCSIVADYYFGWTEERLLYFLVTKPKESVFVTIYVLFKVGQVRCPTYWVNKDLLEALLNSKLAVEPGRLNWAMKTGMFVIPKGAIPSPGGLDITAIFWHLDTEDETLYWTATDNYNFFSRRYPLQSNHKVYTDAPNFAAQIVTEFNEYIQALLLRLLLIMECRPEFVETTSETVRVSKGFSNTHTKDLYQPLWLGKNYQIKRQRSGNGTHASPDMHWRRGFLRDQPHGKGRQLRKLKWIEPVLVMGKLASKKSEE